MISSKIDRWGPEGALKETRRTMTRLLAEIRRMERK
jgi:hypothetical protein